MLGINTDWIDEEDLEKDKDEEEGTDEEEEPKVTEDENAEMDPAAFAEKIEQEAAASFKNIETIDAKDAKVTVYTYVHENEEAEQLADIKIYAVEKEGGTYYFATIMRHHVSTPKNLTLFEDVWSSFTPTEPDKPIESTEPTEASEPTEPTE